MNEHTILKSRFSEIVGTLHYQEENSYVRYVDHTGQCISTIAVPLPLLLEFWSPVESN
ncbi:hypothetical protein NQ117_09470 [Paenibacillus sp. SC116]|nr:hypothetical protein [Paenibacillus sp. SC116]